MSVEFPKSYGCDLCGLVGSISHVAVNELTVFRNGEKCQTVRQILAEPGYLVIVVGGTMEFVARTICALVLTPVLGIPYFIGRFCSDDLKELSEGGITILWACVTFTGAAVADAVICLKDNFFKAPIPLKIFQKLFSQVKAMDKLAKEQGKQIDMAFSVDQGFSQGVDIAKNMMTEEEKQLLAVPLAELPTSILSNESCGKIAEKFVQSISHMAFHELTVLRNDQTSYACKRILAEPGYLAIAVVGSVEFVARAICNLVLIPVLGILLFIGCLCSDGLKKLSKDSMGFLLAGGAATGVAVIEAVMSLWNNLYKDPIVPLIHKLKLKYQKLGNEQKEQLV
jgi:hypothetical protein